MLPIACCYEQGMWSQATSPCVCQLPLATAAQTLCWFLSVYQMAWETASSAAKPHCAAGGESSCTGAAKTVGTSAAFSHDDCGPSLLQVGGDGLFQEALNGLLLLRARSPELGDLAARMRLGHIPAGSTDAVAYSLNGTRSELTAALHVALGDRWASIAAHAFQTKCAVARRHALPHLKAWCATWFLHLGHLPVCMCHLLSMECPATRHDFAGMQGTCACISVPWRHALGPSASDQGCGAIWSLRLGRLRVSICHCLADCPSTRFTEAEGTCTCSAHL